jgi:hypothetical protein
MPRVGSDEAMDEDLVALQRRAVQPEACRRDLKHGCLREVAGRTGRLRVRVLDRLRKRGLALIGKLASRNLYRKSPSILSILCGGLRSARPAGGGSTGAHKHPG